MKEGRVGWGAGSSELWFRASVTIHRALGGSVCRGPGTICDFSAEPSGLSWGLDEIYR